MKNHKRKSPKIVVKRNDKFLGSLVYVIGMVLIIGWVIAYFGFHTDRRIHLLLIIGVLAIVIKLIDPKRL